MKHSISILFTVVLLATMSAAQLSIEDLEGTWSGPVAFPFLLVLTEQGVDSICCNTFPPECEKTLLNGTETLVIENGTTSLGYVGLVGVNTTEKSIALFPECAASGVFPFETITPLPLIEIQSYDPVTGHLIFIDSRRPDDLNCVIITLKEGEDNAPSTITVRYILASTETLVNNVEFGLSFRCATANELCISNAEQDGDYTAYVYIEFVVPRGEGACLAASKHH